jgi:hypothetical protein
LAKGTVSSLEPAHVQRVTKSRVKLSISASICSLLLASRNDKTDG